MVIRLALLSHHYREDWMWTEHELDHATERLDRWREAVRLDAGLNADEVLVQVRAALAHDLDAPTALAAVDAWAGASTAIDSDDTDAPSLVARAATDCSASASIERSSDVGGAVGLKKKKKGYDSSRRVNNSRVFRGRCNSEPAVTVRDPVASSHRLMW